MNERFNLIVNHLLESSKVKNISQFAKSINSYNHIIYYINTNKRNVSISMIIQLAEVYNINPNYIFGYSDNMFL
jgi:plasmid maintenance system antidote protein VapI